MAKSNVGARKRRRWPWVLLGVVVVAAAGWAAVSRPWEAKAITVETETVTPGHASRVLAVNGRIEPDLQINVEPTVSGQVRSVPVSEGQTVTAGSLLASIDDTQQKAAVSQAEAALDAARAQRDKAQSDYERAQGLGDSISQKDLGTARVALQTAQNDVARLQAARDQALSQLAAFSITAPFDGTVLTRGVDPGQVVGTSTVLFSFADLTRLRASASIDELYAAEIRRGLKVRMQPAGYNQMLDGTVTFVSPTVDSNTGGRMVRVGIDEDTSAMALPIGLTVNLNIVVDEQASAITVPRAAILNASTRPTVLVVRDGKAVEAPVDFVDWPAGRLIVKSGLQSGDVVITDPTPSMNGATVKAQAG